MIKKDFNLNNIDKQEVWRYLGRTNQEITPEIDELTESLITETLNLAKPLAVYLNGPIIQDENLSLLNCSLEGDAIKDLLHNGEEGYIFAATLGFQVDKRIKQYEILDLTKALIMDACASVIIEEVCNEVNQEIDKQIEERGQYSTERFSPGYSDLPLSIQSSILKELDTQRKIGLTCSETSLLFPRKSVTAIIGILDEPRKPRGYICKDCILRKNCKFGICRRKI